MSTPVVAIAPDETVRAAAQRMRDRNLGALAVVDGEELAGVLTDRDITVRGTAAGLDAERTSVRALMTAPAIACSADEDLGECAVRMAERAVRRLPVVDASGRLVGMLSADDLAAAASDERASEIIGAIQEPAAQPRR